jgi:hypothetical protein
VAPGGPGLKKWCLSLLECASVIEVCILHNVLHGQITKYYTLQGKMLRGSRGRSGAHAKAPYTTPLAPLQINLLGELHCMCHKTYMLQLYASCFIIMTHIM